MSDDIGHILRSWPMGDDDEVTVRLVEGDDGNKKIQMRIDMGIIQLHRDGHPAEERPYGFESWLEYYEYKIQASEKKVIDEFFSLNSDDVKLLQREGTQYYYRYLSLMKLNDYQRVVRDTSRNLRLFAFVKRYADREADRWMLDQYRPYVIMMHTQAKASVILESGGTETAIRVVEECDRGIREITEFYREYDLNDQADDSLELTIIRTLRAQFARESPEPLESQLNRAIDDERFEDAARIRDEIRRLISGENENSERNTQDVSICRPVIVQWLTVFTDSSREDLLLSKRS